MLTSPTAVAPDWPPAYCPRLLRSMLLPKCRVDPPPKQQPVACARDSHVWAEGFVYHRPDALYPDRALGPKPHSSPETPPRPTKSIGYRGSHFQMASAGASIPIGAIWTPDAGRAICKNTRAPNITSRSGRTARLPWRRGVKMNVSLLPPYHPARHRMRNVRASRLRECRSYPAPFCLDGQKNEEADRSITGSRLAHSARTSSAMIAWLYRSFTRLYCDTNPPVPLQLPAGYSPPHVPIFQRHSPSPLSPVLEWCVRAKTPPAPSLFCSR